MRTVNADHQYGGQRRHLDCDPHEADIVGNQREVHREHQHLIHGMIEAHESRRQPADLDLMPDVTRAEHAGRKTDECRQNDEDLVEVVDQQIGAGARLDEEQRYRRQECQQRCKYVQARAETIAGQGRKEDGCSSRNSAKRPRVHR